MMTFFVCVLKFELRALLLETLCRSNDAELFNKLFFESDCSILHRNQQCTQNSVALNIINLFHLIVLMFVVVTHFTSSFVSLMAFDVEYLGLVHCLVKYLFLLTMHLCLRKAKQTCSCFHSKQSLMVLS